jgi:3-hydroxy-9,10-secoandrosta-1,3,5(10)-triene-9,17-dione monooxygenase
MRFNDSMTLVKTAPDIEDLTERARAMIPTLRQRAQRTELLRHVPQETIDEFRRAGFFRLFQPKRYGGYEFDYGVAQIEIGLQLGRACPSSAWVQSVLASHAWLLGMFPQAAQDAVWQSSEDALITTAFSNAGGRAIRVDGGYDIAGKWEFASGSDASDWLMILAPVDDSKPVELRVCLLRRPQWRTLDNWDGMGLRGTGSHDVQIDRAFVPADHTVTMSALQAGQGPIAAPHLSYIYRLPLIPALGLTVIAPALGAARGGLEAFIELAKTRADHANEPARHLRISESAAEIDCAEMMLRAFAATVHHVGTSGEPLYVDDRVRLWRDSAYIGRLCVRAVQRLVEVLGAHGVHDSNPVQRAHRDLLAMTSHVGRVWDKAGMPYGRVALGLDPGDPSLGGPQRPAAW